MRVKTMKASFPQLGATVPGNSTRAGAHTTSILPSLNRLTLLTQLCLTQGMLTLRRMLLSLQPPSWRAHPGKPLDISWLPDNGGRLCRKGSRPEEARTAPVPPQQPHGWGILLKPQRITLQKRLIKPQSLLSQESGFSTAPQGLQPSVPTDHHLQ